MKKPKLVDFPPDDELDDDDPSKIRVVWVDKVTPDTSSLLSNIAFGEGQLDTDRATRVWFTGDRREIIQIAIALSRGEGPVRANVMDYQISYVDPPGFGRGAPPSPESRTQTHTSVTFSLRPRPH